MKYLSRKFISAETGKFWIAILTFGHLLKIPEGVIMAGIAGVVALGTGYLHYNVKDATAEKPVDPAK